MPPLSREGRLPPMAKVQFYPTFETIGHGRSPNANFPGNLGIGS
jgi:hypothetical protein